MKQAFCIIILFLIAFTELGAQENILLNSRDTKNKQTINVKLHDMYNGEFLMDIPLTFHIMKGKDRDILFMILGQEINKRNPQTVWMFRNSCQLDELLKKNRNLKASKDFKKRNEHIESFFESSDNIKLMDFPDDFEKVGSTPKPVFFEVKDANKPFELKLKFYISIPDKDETIQVLTAKAGVVRVTFDITN